MSDLHHEITESNVWAWLATPRPWALLPQTMVLMTGLASGMLTIPEAVERGTERAQLRERTPERRGRREEPILAVIGLRGLITPRGTWLDAMCGGGGGLEAFQEALIEAATDDDVSAILLDVDSPGGQVDLVSETAALVREVAAEKPVSAIANTMAASAAYWIVSGAREVVVTPSGLVGSIGVFATHVDYSAREEMLGIKTTLISAGKHKVDGNPHEPLSADGRKGFQEVVDDTYALFAAGVAAGRGVPESTVRDGFGEGRILTAKRAVTAGLADRVESIGATIERLVAGGAEPERIPLDPPGEPEPDSGDESEVDAESAAIAERLTQSEKAADNRRALEAIAAVDTAAAHLR